MDTVKLINEAVDKYRDSILETERYIWNNPETGYREWKTHAHLKAKYEALGDKVLGRIRIEA